jgi:hypothetical protein
MAHLLEFWHPYQQTASGQEIHINIPRLHKPLNEV